MTNDISILTKKTKTIHSFIEIQQCLKNVLQSGNSWDIFKKGCYFKQWTLSRIHNSFYNSFPNKTRYSMRKNLILANKFDWITKIVHAWYQNGAEKLEALVMSAKKKSCFHKEDKHFFLFGMMRTNPAGTIKLRKSRLINKHDFYVMLTSTFRTVWRWSARTAKCLILPVPPRDRNVPECEEEFTPPNTVTPWLTGAWKLL